MSFQQDDTDELLRPYYINTIDKFNPLLAKILNVQNINIDIDYIEKYSILKQIIIKMLSAYKNEGITIIIEDNNVNPVYRDSYYLYFSQRHFDYERNCKRLFFFSSNISAEIQLLLNCEAEINTNYINVESTLQDKFIGCMVLRPFTMSNMGIVGLTVLKPESILEEMNNSSLQVKICKYTFSMNGIHLIVCGFPFMMQDSVTISCAEVTLLLLLDYNARSFPEYHNALPSHIHEIVNQIVEDRTIPTLGLSYLTLTRILKEFGFAPRLYSFYPFKHDLRMIMHGYVESSIPLAVGVRQISSLRKNYEQLHSIVCIDHGEKNTMKLKDKVDIVLAQNEQGQLQKLCIADASKAYDRYIFMDDNRCPYIFGTINNKEYFSKDLELKFLDNGDNNTVYQVINISVPLNKSMSMEVKDARDIFQQILKYCWIYHFCNLPPEMQIYFNQKMDLLPNPLAIETEQFFPGKEDKNPLVLRFFLTTARSYKEFRIKHTNSPDLRRVYLSLELPRFIWLCETFSLRSFEVGQAIGEIVLDATSSKDSQMESAILLNLPFHIAERNHFGYPMGLMSMYNEGICIDNWEPFPAFRFRRIFPHFGEIRQSQNCS